MINRSHWYGCEIEGAHIGVYTLFVRGTDTNLLKILGMGAAAELPAHVYYTIEYILNACEDDRDHPRLGGSPLWVCVRGLLFDLRRAVTIEVNEHTIKQVPHDIRNAAHMIYRITDAQGAELLKPSDTVSLDLRPYNVLQVRRHAFLHVTPEQYRGDTEHDTRKATT